MKYEFRKVKVRGHKRYDPRLKKKVTVSSYSRKQRYRIYENISREMALRRFKNRSLKSRVIDLKSTSKKVFDEPNEYWLNHVNRTDVEGIDTQATKKETKPKGKKKSFSLSKESKKVIDFVKNDPYNIPENLLRSSKGPSDLFEMEEKLAEDLKRGNVLSDDERKALEKGYEKLKELTNNMRRIAIKKAKQGEIIAEGKDSLWSEIRPLKELGKFYAGTEDSGIRLNISRFDRIGHPDKGFVSVRFKYEAYRDLPNDDKSRWKSFMNWDPTAKAWTSELKNLNKVLDFLKEKKLIVPTTVEELNKKAWQNLRLQYSIDAHTPIGVISMEKYRKFKSLADNYEGVPWGHYFKNADSKKKQAIIDFIRNNKETIKEMLSSDKAKTSLERLIKPHSGSRAQQAEWINSIKREIMDFVNKIK